MKDYQNFWKITKIYVSICVPKIIKNTMRFDKVIANIKGCIFSASQCGNLRFIFTSYQILIDNIKAVTRIFSGGVTLSLSTVGAKIGVGSGEGVSPPQKIFAFFISKWWVFVHACMDFMHGATNIK